MTTDADLLAQRFELHEEVGRGGLAEVWRATDTRLGGCVALKMLHAHLAQQRVVIERFRREVVLSRQLVHPAIVRVFDHYEDHDRVFFTMEFCPGTTLKDHLRLHGPPAHADRMAMIRSLAQALEAAHAQGVVHRDIKPHNVMRLPDGTVKLLDFGLARVESMVGLTSHSVMLGTPDYMAPEAIQGLPVDGRADLYSLGVLWFELASGALPFSAHTPWALMQRISGDPAPPVEGPDVDPRERALIAQLLSTDAADRFASAREFLDALDRPLAPTTSDAEAPPERCCPMCGADQTGGPSFCLACGVERDQVATTGDRILALLRVGKGAERVSILDPWQDILTHELSRHGAPPLRAHGAGAVQALPEAILKGVDPDFAVVLQRALLERGLTVDIRRMGANNIDLLRLERVPRIYFTVLALGLWATALGSVGWVYWQPITQGHWVGPGALVSGLALAGLALGWVLQFRTHLFLSPPFALESDPVDHHQRGLGQRYRRFLETVSDPALRRLGAQLSRRCFALLKALAPLSRATELEDAAVDAATQGLRALAAVQALEDAMPCRDTRAVWEALEAAETQARMAPNPQQHTLAQQRVAQAASELRALGELEQDRARRIHAVLKLGSELEGMRQAVALGGIDAAGTADLGARLRQEAEWMQSAQHEVEALAAR